MQSSRANSKLLGHGLHEQQYPSGRNTRCRYLERCDVIVGEGGLIVRLALLPAHIRAIVVEKTNWLSKLPFSFP